MNGLAIPLLSCVLQVTLLTLVAGALYLALRRLAPAARSLVPLTALVLVAALSLLALSPWPRWSFGANSPLARTEQQPRMDLSGSSSAVSGDGATTDESNSIRQNSADATAKGTSPTTFNPEKPSFAAEFWEVFNGELQQGQAAQSSQDGDRPSHLAPGEYTGGLFPSPAAIAVWSARIVAGLMAFLVFCGIVRLLGGLVAVRLCRGRSRPLGDAELREQLDLLRAELGCPRPVELRESSKLATAAVVGCRWPVILLPPQWRQWTATQRRAVLAHEVAHITRNDFVTWLAAQFGLVLHFYHPLVHWLAARLRLEQELAADAVADSALGGDQTYLKALAELALRQPDQPVGWPARAFLPTRRTFVRRIEMLRNIRDFPKVVSPWKQAALVGTMLAVGLILSGVRAAQPDSRSADFKTETSAVSSTVDQDHIQQERTSRSAAAAKDSSRGEPGWPPKLRGVVTAVEDQQLVEISIGSDDGLRRGHTLVVFRGKNYLGQITVQRVAHDKSVGRIDRLKGEIRRGDHVSTESHPDTTNSGPDATSTSGDFAGNATTASAEGSGVADNSTSVVEATFEPDRAPLSLAYVPRDAVMLAAVRPAELLKRAAMKPLAAAFREEDAGVLFGIPLAKVEQLTLVFLPQAQPHQPGVEADQAGWIIRLTEPLTPEQHAAVAGKNPEDIKYGGTSYYRSREGRARWIHQPDGKMLIVGDEEPYLRRMIIAGPRGAARASWADVWSSAAAVGDLGLFVDLAALRARLNAEIGPDLSGFGGLGGRRSKFADLAPLWQNTRRLAVGGWVGEDGLRLQGIGVADDPKAVLQTLQKSATLARNQLSQARERASRLSDEQGGPLMLRSLDVADEMLDNVKVESEGQNVLITSSVKDGAVVARLAATFAPAVGAAREAAQRTRSMKNLKQIALAFHNYHATYGRFPPAVVTHKEGKKLEHPHSWRVAILPFLDEATLYEKYRFDEPWDSEQNKQILEKMPHLFRHPAAEEGSTNACYFGLITTDSPRDQAGADEETDSVFAADTPAAGAAKAKSKLGTVFHGEEGTALREITDGTSNTILVVEARRDIPWTKPEDIPYDPDKPLPKLGGFHKDGFTAVMCDGAARFLSKEIGEETLRRLITRNDGQPIQQDTIFPPRR